MVVSSVCVRLKVDPPPQHRAVAVGLSLCNHIQSYFRIRLFLVALRSI